MINEQQKFRVTMKYNEPDLSFPLSKRSTLTIMSSSKGFSKEMMVDELLDKDALMM